MYLYIYICFQDRFTLYSPNGVKIKSMGGERQALKPVFWIRLRLEKTQNVTVEIILRNIEEFTCKDSGLPRGLSPRLGVILTEISSRDLRNTKQECQPLPRDVRLALLHYPFPQRWILFNGFVRCNTVQLNYRCRSSGEICCLCLQMVSRYKTAILLVKALLCCSV